MSKDEIKKYLAKIGAKGGGSTSAAKRRAVTENLKRARAARWPVQAPKGGRR